MDEEYDSDLEKQSSGSGSGSDSDSASDGSPRRRPAKAKKKVAVVSTDDEAGNEAHKPVGKKRRVPTVSPASGKRPKGATDQVAAMAAAVQDDAAGDEEMAGIAAAIAASEAGVAGVITIDE